jgi:hypothetical protein
MKENTATAEIYRMAFHSLSKAQKKEVLSLLLQDKEFTKDLEDIIAIEKSRREKGKDIPFDQYLKNRKRNAG